MYSNAICSFATTCACVWLLVGCGGRTPVVGAGLQDDRPQPRETCNGRDDDDDLAIDEDFRDAQDRYVSDEHCGGCGRSCDAPQPHAGAVHCSLIDDIPTCSAQSCEYGFGLSSLGRCVALTERLCLACNADSDCGTLPGAQCVSVGAARHCAIGCEQGCPDGYACSRGGTVCLPNSGDCSCGPGESFSVACEAESPSGKRCTGRRRCVGGLLTECSVGEETCNGEDDDCDDLVDEGFVNALGMYSLDDDHCGACGKSCSRDADAGVPLTCGGDPYAPSCVLHCPDADDGTQVGDRLDADRDLGTGCECTVVNIEDRTGLADGETQLDANCDGADGSANDSLYVAVDGNDFGTGSALAPLRTISKAVALAAASLQSGVPRPHVYVASGTYAESVELPDGVLLHGGYRRDFLARNPDGFEVILVAPVGTTTYGGAALWMSQVGTRPTLAEGLVLRGQDVDEGAMPALGVYVDRPGRALTLRDLEIRPGRAAAPPISPAGILVATPLTAASAGNAPRAAAEDPAHDCIDSPENVSFGGLGGKNVCSGVDVSGGNGGNADCPEYPGFEADGEPGVNDAGGGAAIGGVGGMNVSGPIWADSSCAASVCCGLADFYVPGAYTQAAPGQDGRDGNDGAPGAGCSEPLGSWYELEWMPGPAGVGVPGAAGGGGAGGGAGGGTRMSWFATECEFADGIGGGGGGGGGGGCGGGNGEGGLLAAPRIGLLMHLSDKAELPTLEQLVFEVGDGAAGGGGGAGAGGAPGASGAEGGSTPAELLVTPTLAGAAPGGRGGHGGSGGAGGSGGGGCGGSAIGLWIHGLGTDPALGNAMRAAHSFTIGQGGPGGPGGSGAVPAAAGQPGASLDVRID